MAEPTAIGEIDDTDQIRVQLYQSGRSVHTPLQNLVDAGLTASLTLGPIVQANIPIYATETGMSAQSVPVGTTALRLNGYAAVGDGGAALFKKAASEPSHAGKFQSADGAWWELSRQFVNPFMFGARGDGATDDGAALTAFFGYISSVDCGTADAGGDFRTSVPLFLGPAAGSIATRKVTGRMKVTATAAIEKVITIRNCNRAVWDGLLDVFGTGSTTVSTRTCTHGVVFENNTRFRIGGINAQYFRGYGVLIDGDSATPSNNNRGVYGAVQVYDCGTLYSNAGTLTGLSSTFSARSDTGSSGSTAQRSVLTVATLPDTWIDASLNGQQHFIIYSGKVHYIYAVDRGLSTVSVYPWLSGSDVTGTIYYCVGAGVYTRGGDAGQLSFSGVDALRCATGYGNGALYGSDVADLQMQACAIGLALGPSPAGASASGVFTKPYFETNTVDILRVTRVVPPTFSYRIIDALLADDLVKMQACGAARLSGGAINTTFDDFEGIHGLGPKGLGYEKPRDNAAADTNAATFTLDAPDKSVHWRRKNASTLTITLAYDPDLNRLYGYDSGTVKISGTGTYGGFTGTATFAPPSGETINGGAVDATASFTGFFGPATFSVFRLGTDWKILLVSGREHPEAVTTIATDADATLTPWSTLPSVIHTGTLTADRAITLSTTNAVAGVTRFRITRTGGGAFNLNVGTGPLKALATNTWAEFTYNGSAYVLTAYGAL